MNKFTILVWGAWGTRERGGRMPVGKLLIGLGAIVAFLSVSAGGAGAFNPVDLAKLKATNKCLSCDLSGADLNGASLSRAELRAADLTGANLAGANLSMARLDSVFANKANLNGANLSGATWTNGRPCAAGSIGVCK